MLSDKLSSLSLTYEMNLLPEAGGKLESLPDIQPGNALCL